MSKIPMESVSVVVTSPPYNIGISYGVYKDALPAVSYGVFMDRWTRNTLRVLEQEGSVFLNLGSRPQDPGFPFRVLDIVTAGKRFKLQNVIHWIKSITIEDDPDSEYARKPPLSTGHFKPINSPRYLNDCHEYIFHLTKTGNVPLDRLAVGVPYTDKSNLKRGTRGKHGDVRCRGNNWFIPYPTIKERKTDRPHPASFPARLPEMCIRLHGVERTKLVLDPFMGIGSTALACQKLGVPCIGFDIDKDYCETTKHRLAQKDSDITVDIY